MRCIKVADTDNVGYQLCLELVNFSIYAVDIDLGCIGLVITLCLRCERSQDRTCAAEKFLCIFSVMTETTPEPETAFFFVRTAENRNCGIFGFYTQPSILREMVNEYQPHG